MSMSMKKRIELKSQHAKARGLVHVKAEALLLALVEAEDLKVHHAALAAADFAGRALEWAQNSVMEAISVRELERARAAAGAEAPTAPATALEELESEQGSDAEPAEAMVRRSATEPDDEDDAYVSG